MFNDIFHTRQNLILFRADGGVLSQNQEKSLDKKAKHC